jgi:hypothetical protein
MKTPQDYLASLAAMKHNVWLNGQKVERPWEHPQIVPGINIVGLTYEQVGQVGGGDSRISYSSSFVSIARRLGLPNHPAAYLPQGMAGSALPCPLQDGHMAMDASRRVLEPPNKPSSTCPTDVIASL